MNDNFESLRNNFSLELLLSGSFLIQLIVIVGAIGAAFFLEKLIRKNIIKNADEKKLVLNDTFKILRPLFMVGILAFFKYFLDSSQPTRLLYITLTILGALIIIRLTIILFRYLLQPGPWLRTLENTIATIIALIFISNAFGAIGDFTDFLSNIQFTFGSQTLSLLIILETIIGVITAIIVAMTLAQFLENRLMKIENSKLDMNKKIMFGKVLRIALYVFAIVIALNTVGVDLTFLTVFGGAFGVGLAFGMQKIASNYISGFIILVDKSVRIGDILEVGEHYGRVSSIKSRFTVLKRLDGVEVVIPNESWISENIINYTYSDRKTKVALDIQISYSSSVDKAFEIILKAVKNERRVLDNPAPNIFLKEFADSGINIHASIYINDPEEGSLGLKSDLYRKIWVEFQNNGIDIPFPTRTVQVINQKDPLNTDKY
jgi:small-conductance mechanosensitive channel